MEGKNINITVLPCMNANAGVLVWSLLLHLLSCFLSSSSYWWKLFDIEIESAY